MEMSRKILEGNPFMNMFGIELLEVSEGYVKGRIPFSKKLSNTYGDFHGGALYSAADTLCGIAAATYGYFVTTTNGSIQYLKAGRDTEYVILKARTVKAGRNITVVSFEILDMTGMLLNTGSFEYYNLSEFEEESL